jgi:uncharacterized heparinase superfamily protein
MLNLSRNYFYTLKYLRPRQLIFRTFFRLKEKTAYLYLPLFKDYTSFYPVRTIPDPLTNVAEGKYLGNNTFCFLNLENNFGDKVNWNFQGHGKLWNLNLQYFDYLHDAGIPREEKIRLIEDYCEQIKAKKIWLEAYPVSLRLANWIIFASKENYVSKDFIYCLSLQTKFLFLNLEYHILANHYLENLITLTICANAFRDEKLMRFCVRSLKSELKEEILEDGQHYEASPMYHSIILTRLLQLVDILENKNNNSDCLFLQEVVQKMAGWLKQFMLANGGLANFNDSAKGIAPEPLAILDYGKRLGIAAIEHFSVLRSDYRKLSNSRMEAIIDVGNIKPDYQPGHAHADMLSFTLTWKGEEIFIDPGVSTYEANERRLLERSTLFHNTVTVNNDNQSDIWSSFRVGRRAILTIYRDEPQIIVASHDGYEKFGCIHIRSFQINDDRLIIKDDISGKIENPNKLTARYYLDPGAEIRQIEIGKYSINEKIQVEFIGCENVLIEKVLISDGFNKLVPSKRIIIEFISRLETTCTQKLPD